MGGIRKRGGAAGYFCSGMKGGDLGSMLRKTVIPLGPAVQRVDAESPTRKNKTKQNVCISLLQIVPL